MNRADSNSLSVSIELVAKALISIVSSLRVARLPAVRLVLSEISIVSLPVKTSEAFVRIDSSSVSVSIDVVASALEESVLPETES